MRGGLERWKRGVDSHGVRHAIAYAFEGTCDAHLRRKDGIEALGAYSEAASCSVSRYIVMDGAIASDELSPGGLQVWLTGHDPVSGKQRGTARLSPDADLVLDGTINMPKTYSVAALLDPEIAFVLESLQDRLRDQVLRTWQSELNARRGHGGAHRMPIRRIEVVELRHRRSRALDPHIHRHLWLNVKVQGQDGRWTNVDSRVAMRLHTLINAEGELAARTDPAWVAALARHGYTMDDTGEIAQLTAAIRPLSRRSTQIETNRARLLAQWEVENPDVSPSRRVLQQLDKLAWALGRPNKPGQLSEDGWEGQIRDEIAAVVPGVLAKGHPVAIQPADQASLDRNLLARRAVVDADKRSSTSGGRFSLLDLRAGVVRALAASGVVAERRELEAVIEDATARAAARCLDLLEQEVERPAHVKAYTASSTATLKRNLVELSERLTEAGTPRRPEHMGKIAARLNEPHLLSSTQERAAAAIAGTDRIVTVTGPAGAGKTTMLRVAASSLALEHRRMVVVAPTRKAANVAGREVRSAATSLHALLADYGWRWSVDDAGADRWSRLARGDVDPWSGTIYQGPRRYLLGPNDRVVVDEAGMLDLVTANALHVVAANTGAGIALVGDPRQALPVGHSGAFAILAHAATTTVELDAVHRFSDPAYAEVTLAVRDASTEGERVAVAAVLVQRGHVLTVASHAEALDSMVEMYFDSVSHGKQVALVCATNADVAAISEAVQQRRIESGELDPNRLAFGRDEQRLLEGDVVQTRQNHAGLDVENRATWTVRRIDSESIELESSTVAGLLRRVSHDYAAAHLHLSYASTVHGVQGETADASIVGPGVDAAGLYVGMTRGRHENRLLVVAQTDWAARDEVADILRRGAVEATLHQNRAGARSDYLRAARDPQLNRDAAAPHYLSGHSAARGLAR